MTLANIEGDVAESTTIVVPASAKVNTAVKPVLDEKPSWENKRENIEDVYQTLYLQGIYCGNKLKELKLFDGVTELFSDLHSGWTDHRRPCMVGRRGQAGSSTSGILFLHDGRYPHTPYLNNTREETVRVKGFIDS